MSIIEQALRKATGSSSKMPQLLDKDTQKLKIKRIKLLGFCSLGIFAVGALLIAGLNKNQPQDIQVLSKDTHKAALTQAPILKPPLRRLREPRPLHLNLTGIVYEEGDSYCILNGKLYQEGDRISKGVRLSKIHPRHIEIQTPTERLSLKLKKRF